MVFNNYFLEGVNYTYVRRVYTATGSGKDSGSPSHVSGKERI